MHKLRSTRTASGVTLLVCLLCAALLSFQVPCAGAASGSGSSVWGANYFPDSTLTSHEGKKLRFFTDLIKGKVVVINFIFTECPDECALETARLLEVQRLLGDRVGRDVFMYSISIDPEHDTPKVLNEYAKKFQIGPGWLFLTGKDAEITELRRKLGLYSDADKDNKLGDHNLSLMIGNQSTGQWMKVSPYENPYVLATQVGSWLHNWKQPPRDSGSYAEAPKLRALATGEELFRTRCAACHTIGSDKNGVGPDLLGVTEKREHAWLVRWLAETDRMLAEKDPLAMELLVKYNNLAMPNLRLTPTDLQSVITYIEEESHRAEHEKHHHHSAEHRHGEHEHGDHDHGDHAGHEHGM